MKSSFSVGIAQFCLTKGEEKKVYIFFQTIIGFNYGVCVCVKKLSFLSMDQLSSFLWSTDIISI